VSISVVKCIWVKCIWVKCIWVKCVEVLQCSDGPSNKVSNSIRRHIDNMKWLFIYSLGSIFYQCIYGCIPV
jgi:hypothetical protein